MKLIKVYCNRINKEVMVNTNNITYIECLLPNYIIHITSGDEFYIDKQDYIKLIGEFIK